MRRRNGTGMDPVSIATALVGSQMADVQMALAARMLRMNADNASAIVQVLDAAQKNLQSLANVAEGVGRNLNISAYDLAQSTLLPERRPDQPDRIVAGPFCGPRNRPDFASFRVDQHRGRHSEGTADGLEVLKNPGGRVGVVDELLHADL